jgi:predicted nucleotidyltransferase
MTEPKTLQETAPLDAARQARLQRELERYLALLIRSGPPEKIILFGSLAKGEVSKWSDLDLVIVQQTDLPFLERSKRVLCLLRPQVGLDVLIYTPEEFEQLSQERRFFREEILDKGKVLYERSS